MPFTVTIPPEEQDRGLPDKLRAELPGILRWAVEGCRRWQAKGLGMPEEIRHATAAYRQDMDLLGSFIEDRCVETPDGQATAGSLYTDYLAWCEKAEEKPVTKKRFGHLLIERGVQSIRTNAWRGWQGVRLRGPDDEPAWITEP